MMSSLRGLSEHVGDLSLQQQEIRTQSTRVNVPVLPEFRYHSIVLLLHMEAHLISRAGGWLYHAHGPCCEIILVACTEGKGRSESQYE